ncbi:ubiquitin-like domain-containing protein [uncultured Jatrophihabitans sp.]|uniref:aggregation-promoting factor C-terminal-like domain-containing protein n=1 Tax=uncultured Jatrophihabitans sp. TaxID=1610747 RepID=UPI0035C993FD
MLRTIKYGVNAAVLAGLIATPVVWAGVDKSVHLVVDGKARTVSTTADQVGQVLAAHGYHVDSHDLVAPAEKSDVRDGAKIVLRRGRLLKLDVDGRTAQVWTTAPTVSAALGELGYPAGDFVSVSRSRRLPLGATSIAIRTPSAVTVVHDGRQDHVQTTAPTVSAVLTQLGVTLGPVDRVSVPGNSPVHPGELIRVDRVITKQVTKVEALPFPTSTRNNPKLTAGKTNVLKRGHQGKVRNTYAVLYIDGKVAGQARLSSQTLTAARQQIVELGTKKAAKHKSSSGGGGSAPNTPNAPAPTPGSAKAIAKKLLAQHGWGDDQYSCLVSMWNHESGWRVHASNGGSGAYGIPQALPGSKMASAGPDWQDNAETQIKWGLKYIESRYHDPCNAWSTWQAHGGWYY